MILNLIQTVIHELLHLKPCEMKFFIWDRSAQNIFLKILFRIEQQQKNVFYFLALLYLYRL